MRRRAILGVIAIVVIMLLGTGSTLALLIRHVPAFYQRSEMLAGTERETSAREFCGRITDLYNKFGGDRPWEQEFKQDQLNGYLQCQDDPGDLSAPLIKPPDDVKDLRIALENDLIRVGFRYGEEPWSCIVSVEFRVWLVAERTNLIALELCDFRAGALPLGTRSLIDFITESARRQSIDVTWFRHSGHPIALLQLQANQSRPTFQLRRLEILPGKFVVASSPTRDPGSPAPPPDPPAPPEPATSLPAH